MKALAFALSFVLLGAASAAFAQTHVHQTCDTENAAKECDDGCRKSGEVIFQPDKASGRVILGQFENDRPAAQVVLENCVIVDEKNWRCESNIKVGAGYEFSRHDLADNKYFSIQKVITGRGETRVMAADCARRKKVFGLF